MYSYIKTIIFLLVVAAMPSKAQIINPNVGQKSHPTLNITKIEHTKNQTMVYLSVQNDLASGGWFCADKDITFTTPDGKKYGVVKSENIPTCPQSYSFSYVGETLDFILYFPLLPQVRYADLTENCNDACFWFKGVVFDTQLNSLIDQGYSLYTQGKLKQSVALFEDAINRYPDYPYGVLYFNVIKTYAELNDTDNVKKWYAKLSKSNVRDKDFFKDIIQTRKYVD